MGPHTPSGSLHSRTPSETDQKRVLLIVCRLLVVTPRQSSHTMELLTTLGRNVARLRARKAWTQERLAEETGLHRTYVGGVERGERNISVRNLARIATALDSTPSALLEKHRDDK